MMAARREDVDLWLVLARPEAARHYIKNFDWGVPLDDIPDLYTTDTGRKIDLSRMNDEEAVVVAMDLLRNYQMQDEIADLHLAEALGQVC